MNVARSTFVRRGYLLTALSVAVLLAGFSVTAWAQTTTPLRVGLTMRASPTTLEEGASMDAATPGRVTVTITRSGADTYDDDDDRTTPAVPIFEEDGDHLTLRATCNGEDFTGTSAATECSFDVVVKGTTLSGLGTSNGTTLKFEDGPDTGGEVDKTIELLISDISDNGDWNNETVVLTLDLQQATVRITPADTNELARDRDLTAPTPKLTLKINDDDPMPRLRFDETDIQLAKGNDQMVTVGIGVGARGEGTLPSEGAESMESIQNTLEDLDGSAVNNRGESEDQILLSVSPADAVGPVGDADRGLISITKGGVDLESDSQGMYPIGTIADAVTDGVPLTLEITAKEPSGFRDEMISLMLMDGRTMDRMDADGGGIDDAVPATVTILSGAETPTVTFSTDSISIDEGDSETVHLLAGGMQGDEVGSAAVRVRGDADISLEQNGNPISGTVSFGGNANAELTIVSNSDPSLEDGEEKTATVTITDASGAIIGDPGTVTVTVVGSTAVPVFPLFAQLLLALLLMVGGARLYRRRQG